MRWWRALSTDLLWAVVAVRKLFGRMAFWLTTSLHRSKENKWNYCQTKQTKNQNQAIARHTLNILNVFEKILALWKWDLFYTSENIIISRILPKLSWVCKTRFQLILPIDSHNVTKNWTGHRMHVEGPQICQVNRWNKSLQNMYGRNRQQLTV